MIRRCKSLVQHDLRRTLTAVVALLATLSGGPEAGAQCGGWEATGQEPIFGNVYCVTKWDPDGPGPQPPVIVAGGRFSSSADPLTQYLAAWTPSGWSSIGPRLTGNAHAQALA